MTQLQEAIRDKITKYSDACGMCTDTTKECDTCGITCMLEDLNELQRLANRQDAVRPTAHLENEDNLFGAQNASQTITPTSDRIRQLADILENKHNTKFVTIDAFVYTLRRLADIVAKDDCQSWDGECR